jgi:hypothetical protein
MSADAQSWRSHPLRALLQCVSEEALVMTANRVWQMSVGRAGYVPGTKGLLMP